jgi:hypothetical protein
VREPQRQVGRVNSSEAQEFHVAAEFKVVWQHNWRFVGSGLVAKIAAYSKYVKVWQQNWLLVERCTKV